MIKYNLNRKTTLIIVQHISRSISKVKYRHRPLESRYGPAQTGPKNVPVQASFGRLGPVPRRYGKKRCKCPLQTNVYLFNYSLTSLIRNHYNPEKTLNRKKSPSPSLHNTLPCIFYNLIRNQKAIPVYFIRTNF